MTHLRRMGLPTLLLLLSAVPALAFQAGEVWRGTYVYGNGRAPVQFTLLVTSGQGGRFEGVIVEPNTFGDRAFPELFADVTGNADGTALNFAKTYDGTAGQSHTVNYSGTTTGGGRRANGTWQTQDLNGTFEMHRR